MAPVIQFRKAQRLQCKLAMAIEGLTGLGKSGLALAIAEVFADGNWQDIYALDTENKSLDLFVGTSLHTGVTIPEFNIGELEAEDGFKPSYYHAFRKLAIQQHGKVFISDSLSHCWQYEGGILTMVNEAQVRDKTLNRWTAWGVPEITREKNSIMDLVRSRDIHCISTIRTKEKMEMIEGDDGKKKLQSLGEQQIMMPDFKYEPDLVVTMLRPGDGDTGKAPVVRIVKSRYRIFKFDEEYEMTRKMIEQMYQYLSEGTSPEELLKQQHEDYIKAVEDAITERPARRQIWTIIKDQAGLKDVKLIDIPLTKLKQLYGQLVAD